MTAPTTDRRTELADEFRLAAHLNRWPLLTIEEARRELCLDAAEPTTTILKDSG